MKQYNIRIVTMAILVLISSALRGEVKTSQPAAINGHDKTPASEKYTRIPVKFSLLPMIVLDSKTRVNFSLHLFGDYSTQLAGTSIGFGVSIVGEDTTGAQVAAFGTITGRDMKYAQVSGLANFAGGSSTGLQAAGLFNITGAGATGFQGAGLFNFTLKDSKGMQGAGVFNISGGDLYGAQMAAVFNYAASFHGLQASVVNIAGRKKPESSGAQIGLVNIARDISGVQIGLINIANNVDGVPLGLISIITNGETHVDIWGDEMGMINISLEHGTKNFYNIYTIATRGDTEHVSFGLGWGARGRLWRLTIGGDITANQAGKSSRFFKGESIFHARARLYTGIKIFKRLSLIAGVSYNYATGFGEDNRDPKILKTMHDYTFSYSSDDHRFWPGVFVGVQI